MGWWRNHNEKRGKAYIAKMHAEIDRIEQEYADHPLLKMAHLEELFSYKVIDVWKNWDGFPDLQEEMLELEHNLCDKLIDSESCDLQF